LSLNPHKKQAISPGVYRVITRGNNGAYGGLARMGRLHRLGESGGRSHFKLFDSVKIDIAPQPNPAATAVVPDLTGPLSFPASPTS